MDPDIDANSLQRKVQFDIRMYFARRGCENMEKIRKDDFKLTFNTQTETWFVMKARDEMTKNHKGIKNLEAGVMPENRDDKMCPVRSFRMYQDHLHPENPFMWQKSLEKPNKMNPAIWYGRQHLGKHTLAKFMSDISTNCHLSKMYTNHSIRVTGTTILTRMRFSASEIMSVTGHKSVQSLARYQRTQDKTKIQMGNVMHASMTTSEDNIQNQIQQNKVPALLYKEPTTAAVAPVVKQKENINQELVPFEANFEESNVSDFDLMAIINDIEKEEDTTKTQPVATTTATSNVLNNIPKSMFANCTIQNVTFNINH